MYTRVHLQNQKTGIDSRPVTHMDDYLRNMYSNIGSKWAQITGSDMAWWWTDKPHQFFLVLYNDTGNISTTHWDVTSDSLMSLPAQEGFPLTSSSLVQPWIPNPD